MKRDLASLARSGLDVVIVGGGIQGACLAWEAAQRGLKTGLVEAGDFGAATSWNSLKTIHGGIRHLQRLDLGAFRESARERRNLLRIAPGLVHPLRVVAPFYGHGTRGREAFLAGMLLGNLLGGERIHGTLGAAAVRGLIPELPQAGLTGAAEWRDAQASSTERLLFAFLHAAAGAGALLANHAPVVALLRDAGALAGVRVTDGVDGPAFEVRAKVVVNAAGAGAAAVAALAAVPLQVPLLRAVNLVFARAPHGDFAVAASDRGRFLILAPWQGRTLVGTAYADPAVARAQVEAEFLDSAIRAFPWARLRSDEISLVHEGFVPGHGGASGLWSRPLIVDHAAHPGGRGLVSVVAVKYTTARAVAQRTVDLLRSAYALPAGGSKTAVTPLRVLQPQGETLEERAAFAVSEELAASVEDVVLRRLDLGSAGRPEPALVARVRAVVLRLTAPAAAR